MGSSHTTYIERISRSAFPTAAAVAFGPICDLSHERVDALVSDGNGAERRAAAWQPPRVMAPGAGLTFANGRRSAGARLLRSGERA